MRFRYLQLVWLRGIGALKADSQDSYLGSLWWVLEPMLLAALMYLAFSSGLRGSGKSDFIFFLLCGLFPIKWTMSCIGGGSNSIIVNTGLIGQVYLPKWIFPCSVNLSMLIRFLFVLPVIVFAIWAGNNTLPSHVGSLLILVFVQAFFNLGFSLSFASLTPLIPDLRHVVPVMNMAVMFTSGVFFDIRDRPPKIQEILELNPLVSVLDSYRDILLRNAALDFEKLIYPMFFGGLLLLVGVVLINAFNRYYPRALS